MHNKYVRQLEEVKQIRVRWMLQEALGYGGLTGKELDNAIEDAMNSKLSDLDELIELAII